MDKLMSYLWIGLVASATTAYGELPWSSSLSQGNEQNQDITTTAYGILPDGSEWDESDIFDDVLLNRDDFNNDVVFEWTNMQGQAIIDFTSGIPAHFDRDDIEIDDSHDSQRSLQENEVPETVPLDVKLTCDGYNASPSFRCNCRRVLKFDVIVNCTILERLCNNDNTTCFEQSFVAILDGVAATGRDTLPASRMTTCADQYNLKRLDGGQVVVVDNNETDFGALPVDGDEAEKDGTVPPEARPPPNATRAPVDDFDPDDEFYEEYEFTHRSCVEIQPARPGMFNESVRCGASLDGRLCHACSQCSASATSAGNGDPRLAGNTTITVDCCNVQKDAKMTCGYVDIDSGAALPVFDPPFTHKDCSGAKTTFRTAAMATSGLLVASVIMTTLLFI